MFGKKQQHTCCSEGVISLTAEYVQRTASRVHCQCMAHYASGSNFFGIRTGVAVGERLISGAVATQPTPESRRDIEHPQIVHEAYTALSI